MSLNYPSSAGQPTQAVTAPGSGVGWQNTNVCPVQLLVSAGSTVVTSQSVDGTNYYYLTGLGTGTFRVNPGAWVKFTYLTAPTIAMIFL